MEQVHYVVKALYHPEVEANLCPENVQRVGSNWYNKDKFLLQTPDSHQNRLPSGLACQEKYSLFCYVCPGTLPLAEATATLAIIKCANNDFQHHHDHARKIPQRCTEGRNSGHNIHADKHEQDRLWLP
jgi:hypothetical protein